MNFNVFTKPTAAFEDALANPNLGVALLVAIIAGVLLGIISFTLTSNPLAIITSVVAIVIQLLIMCVILWAFEFMFKGKKGSFREKSFSEIASAVGRLWIIVVAAAVLFNVAVLAFMTGLIILSAIFVILLVVLFVMFLVASYKMVKVVLEAKKGRAIVAWILLMVLTALIWGIIQLAWVKIF